MKTIHYLYFSIFTFLCFFFLTIFIVNGNQIFFDMPVYNFIHCFSLTNFFKFITNFGDVLYILVLLIISYFLFKEKKDWKFLCFMMIFEVCCNVVLKNFFTRPRPSLSWLVNETGFSFPSGHMMAATMFYGLCVYFVFETHLSNFFKHLFAFLAVLLILMIGLSRIYLGVHYASDILGGFLVSGCLLCFGVFFYRSMAQK